MFGVALGSNKLEEEKAEVRQFIERSATGPPPAEVVEAISDLWQSQPIQARIQYCIMKLEINVTHFQLKTIVNGSHQPIKVQYCIRHSSATHPSR